MKREMREETSGSICLFLTVTDTPVCSVAQVIHFMLQDQRKVFISH